MKHTIVLFVMLIMALAARAQGYLSLGIETYLPTGEYQATAPGLWGMGFNVGAMGPVRSVDGLLVGGEFGLDLLGLASENVIYPDGVAGSVSVTHGTCRFLPLARYYPAIKWQARAAPFIEAGVGTRYFGSAISYYEDGFDEPFDEFSVSRSWNATYATGIGCHFIGNDEVIALELRLTYLGGSQATYLTRPSLTILPDGGLDYRTKRSQTDAILLTVAFTMGNLEKLLPSFMPVVEEFGLDEE